MRGLVHLLREARPDIPVLFLDTVHHFPETCEYRDEMVRRWDSTCVTLRARCRRPGSGQRHPGLLRRPQGRPAVRGSGRLRRLVHRLAPRAIAESSEPRRGRTFHAGLGPCPAEGQPARHVDHQTGLGLREGARHSAVAALRPWLHQHRLRAVHDPAVDPSDARSGRWAGQKLECGIHIQPVASE